jgi:hypothetical protein
MAYYNLEPFGDELALMDEHFAGLKSLIANANRDPKQRRKAFGPGDFRLLKPSSLMLAEPRAEKPRVEEQQKSPQEVYSIFRTWARLNKG